MSSFQAIRQIFKTFAASPSFDRCLKHVTLLSAGEGKIVCEMPVLEEHTNMQGSLHGGFTATLIDSVTTCTLATCKQPSFGVSVDLNVSYIASAKIGDTLTITSEVLKRGKTLGFTTATITNQHGNLIASGLHTKFLN